MKTPRILITVSGGVADYVADPGVDVAIVDYDAASTDDEYRVVLAPHWRSLVEPTDAAEFVFYTEPEDE